MKKSKHGLPHVRENKHLKKSAVRGAKPVTDVLSVAAFSIAAFDLAEHGKLTFSTPIEATNRKDLARQLAGVKLAPNQSLLGFRVRGDLRGNGLAPLGTAFPGGVCNLDALMKSTYRALLLQAMGTLELGPLFQADTAAELRALAASVDLTAHDDVFLGFVRAEL